MSIMLNIQSRVPPHGFGEKHPANPHGYVAEQSKIGVFCSELSNSGVLRVTPSKVMVEITKAGGNMFGYYTVGQQLWLEKNQIGC